MNREDDPTLRAALDVWREDTRRAAERVDVHGELADRVVAEALRGPRPVRAPTWYAAAAVLLMGIGVVGTLLASEAADTYTHELETNRWAMLDEEELVNVLATDPQFEPGLGK